MDPQRAEILNEVIARTIERNNTQERLKRHQRELKKHKEEVEKVKDQISALFSIGRFIGEVLRQVDEENYIVKSISGGRHLVGVKPSIDRARLTLGARVALDMTTLTVVQVLPREVDPNVYSMQDLGSEKGTSFTEIGGLQEELRRLREVIELPLTNPELFQRVGITAPKGVLLYGPPGTGKTLLAKAIAANVDASFLKVVASSIMHRYVGESARLIREMFAYAREHEPCILFIDEVDAIGSRRIEGNSSDREVQRTLMELLHQLDGFKKLEKVKVIMATNRPDTLDSALMRPGRLDRKIEIPLPNEKGREDILRIHSSKITKQGEIDFEKLVKLSIGFNGADLRNVCTEAGMFAIRASRDYVIDEDFNKAVRKVADMKKLEGASHQYTEQ